MSKIEFYCGDCLDIMRHYPDGYFDLTFASPPYSRARSYGIGFNLRGDEYIQWCADRFEECYRVTSGITAWVMEGQTRNFEWDANPVLLMAELKRRGIRLRKPPIFHRVGIPGSGGPDYLRNDYEFILVASHGKLPWSDPTACGHEPKWKPGGAMSHQTRDGRVNEKKVQDYLDGKIAGKLHTKSNGDKMRVQCYTPPKKANPGNVIHGVVGGSRMGHELAHENEASFPLSLAEFFVKTFCEPDGTCLDCFCGSGTTAHAALLHGRNSVGIDIRPGKGGIETATRRLNEVSQHVASEHLVCS